MGKGRQFNFNRDLSERYAYACYEEKTKNPGWRGCRPMVRLHRTVGSKGLRTRTKIDRQPEKIV